MFKPGQVVAWSHQVATQHSPTSVLRASVLPPDTLVGIVREPANEAGTWWVVQFPPSMVRLPAFQRAAATHPKPDCLVLTSDELVRVEEA